MPVYREPALKATAILVNAGVSEVFWKHLFNRDNTDAFLHLYDAATANAVTVGTTTPKVSYWVPGAGALDDGPTVHPLRGTGMKFSLGIVVAATTTLTGSGAPTTGVLTNLMYA